MGQAAEKTQDHTQIQQWAEQRGGHPAIVQGTESNREGAGLLRIKFDDSEEDLKDIGWDEFFKTFDNRGLTFLYQNEIDGKPSRFFKLVRE